MTNSEFPVSAQNLILLDKGHHQTRLIVTDAHKSVLHSFVKETHRSFWIVWGRQFVWSIIHECVVCQRLEGRPYKSVPPLPLPDYRVRQSRPFQFTGVDLLVHFTLSLLMKLKDRRYGYVCMRQ